MAAHRLEDSPSDVRETLPMTTDGEQQADSEDRGERSPPIAEQLRGARAEKSSADEFR